MVKVNVCYGITYRTWYIDYHLTERDGPTCWKWRKPMIDGEMTGWTRKRTDHKSTLFWEACRSKRGRGMDNFGRHVPEWIDASVLRRTGWRKGGWERRETVYRSGASVVEEGEREKEAKIERSILRDVVGELRGVLNIDRRAAGDGVEWRDGDGAESSVAGSSMFHV